MWDFRTDVIPLLVLAALGVWSVWLGRGGSMQAKQMREQLPRTARQKQDLPDVYRQKSL